MTNDVLSLLQNNDISQPLIQRYIKVLSDLNKDINELKEIKEQITNLTSK